MTTDYQHLFKAAWGRRDAPAVLDVIQMGLREGGDDFRDWLARDAAPALAGYCISRAEGGCEPPYLDSFAFPIAERLSQVFRDHDEFPPLAWAWLLRNYEPKDWEETIEEYSRQFPQN
jgi:hypothetical protein